MQNRKRDTYVQNRLLDSGRRRGVGCSERTALKQVYYPGWNRSPAQFGCMRQVLGAGALGRPRGMGGRGRWEGGSGWGAHVNSWLIHVNVWRKPLQYCKVISLQLIKINQKKKRKIYHLTNLKKKRRICLQFRRRRSDPGAGRSPGGGRGNHSSVLAWRTPWTEGPGGPQSVGSQRVGHNFATEQQ